jgi:exonuclease VII small subunit
MDQLNDALKFYTQALCMNETCDNRLRLKALNKIEKIMEKKKKLIAATKKAVPRAPMMWQMSRRAI